MRLNEAILALSSAGIDNARAEAREIFMRIGGYPISELISRNPDTLCPAVISAVERRQKREPLQYIIGEVGFFKETYTVSPDCLIPRADTEITVELAIKLLPAGGRILDLCTGSGCIAISTVKNTKDTTAVAVDISEGAIAVARANAKKNGCDDRIEFLVRDVFSFEPNEKFDLILSNPPYVTEEEYRSLEPELYFEPRLALVGEDNGLRFYKHIASAYKSCLSPTSAIIFEIGHLQRESLFEIAEQFGYEAEVHTDYGGRDRVIILRNKK